MRKFRALLERAKTTLSASCSSSDKSNNIWSVLLLERPPILLGAKNAIEAARSQYMELLEISRSRGPFDLSSADVKKGPLDGDPLIAAGLVNNTANSKDSSNVDLLNLSQLPVSMNSFQKDQLKSRQEMTRSHLCQSDITRMLDKRLYLVVTCAAEKKNWILPSILVENGESLEASSERLMKEELFEKGQFETFSLDNYPNSYSSAIDPKDPESKGFYMRREVLGGRFPFSVSSKYKHAAWMTVDELESNLRKDQFEAIEPLIREIN